MQVLDTLAEIQERHDAVVEVERKLLELQQVIIYLFIFFFAGLVDLKFTNWLIRNYLINDVSYD